MQQLTRHIPPMNTAPAGFDIERDLPKRFAAFYKPLHETFTPRQQAIIEQRKTVLKASLDTKKRPDYLPPSPANGEWRVEIPAWCLDQRNQMTGPADDAELVVKMLNSDAPGVMIDLEDSMANTFEHTLKGIDNAVAAYYGELYLHRHEARQRDGRHQGQLDRAVDARARVAPLASRDLPASRPRPRCSISRCWRSSSISRGCGIRSRSTSPRPSRPRKPLWWRDVLQAIAVAKRQPSHAIKCMALVESHPFAYQIEEFAYTLRDHLLGLNLGRWDYMASLIHFNLDDPEWVLPGPQHDPVRRPILSECCASESPRCATATGCSRSAG